MYFTGLHKIYQQISLSENREIIGNFEPFFYTEAISNQPEIISKNIHIYYDTDSSAWNLYGTNVPFKLNENLILVANTTLELPSGFYMFTDVLYGLYYHEATLSNLLAGFNDNIFYFDNDLQTFYLSNANIIYDDDLNDWSIIEHSYVTNEILNDRSKIPTSKAVYDAIQNISPSGSNVTDFTENIVLLANTQTTLEKGFYNTKNYKIYLHSIAPENVLIGNNEVVYVSTGSTIITDNYNLSLVDEDGVIDWVFDNHSGITSEVVDDDTLIPTSKAVYDALQNLPSDTAFYQTLSSDVALTNGTALTLSDGWYYSSNHIVSVNGTTAIPEESFFYVGTASETVKNITIYENTKQYVVNQILDSSNSYTHIKTNSYELLEDSDMTQTINSSSTTTQIPSAKAVYDKYSPNILSYLMTTNTGVDISSSGWSGAVIPLNNEKYKVGNKLSFNSTKKCIVIGSGVSRIKIDLSDLHYTKDTDVMVCAVLNNTTVLGPTIYSKDTVNSPTSRNWSKNYFWI